MSDYENWVSGEYRCTKAIGFCKPGDTYWLIKAPYREAFHPWVVQKYSYYFKTGEVKEYFEPRHKKFNDKLDSLLDE